MFGILALFWPGLTALTLVYIVAFWAILSGIARIAMAIMLRREIENEWSIALSGVLSVILGIVLILLPGAGLLAYTWLIGLLALVVGIALIYYAFRVRGQRRQSDLMQTRFSEANDLLPQRVLHLGVPRPKAAACASRHGGKRARS